MKKLPYRKNCEGYFLYGKNQILAQDTGKGYVVFPGGGVAKSEKPEEALKREVFEETGAIIDEKIRKLGVIHFDWDSDWPKTEKQKERYKKFRGEEMHFFLGKVKKLTKPFGDPKDAWKGRRMMSIDKTIRFIENGKLFSKDIEKYHGMQLRCLRSLRR